MLNDIAVVTIGLIWIVVCLIFIWRMIKSLRRMKYYKAMDMWDTAVYLDHYLTACGEKPMYKALWQQEYGNRGWTPPETKD